MENKKLEKLMNEMKSKGDGAQSEEFLEMLKNATVCVPAVMPKDTKPEVMKKLLQNPGQMQAIPEGAHPQPCILENEKHEKFLAVFTSEAELNKGKKAPKFPLYLNMEFSSCMDFLKKRPDITGAVINAYTHNVIFQLNEQKKAQPKTVQVSLEEFHHLTRNKMESFYLPKKLFEEKEEVVSRLCKEQGAYMKELYEELYTTEVACPYTEEDFEFMALNINEDLLFVQITMPRQYLMLNTCPSVFIAWNQKEQKIWYYAIVMGGAEKGLHLYQLLEDGKALDLGEAPSEGSELSTILDLIQG